MIEPQRLGIIVAFPAEDDKKGQTEQGNKGVDNTQAGLGQPVNELDADVSAVNFRNGEGAGDGDYLKQVNHLGAAG